MTVAYLDASALVKLVVVEEHSEALRAALVVHDTWITSVVGDVEVRRAVRRAAAAASHDVEDLPLDEVLARCGLVGLDAAVRAAAATRPPPALRTLDAIHLASALAIAATGPVVVGYDQRLLDAAQAAGLAVSSPMDHAEPSG